jgi:hypothetical protein
MKDDQCTSMTPVAEGHVLHLREGHEVAIYKRNGVHWVAEFRDGSAELVDATSWFHFHTGALRYSFGNRAAALNATSEITPEVLAQIERLHSPVDRTVRGALAETIVSAAWRWAKTVTSRLHKSSSRRAQELRLTR